MDKETIDKVVKETSAVAASQFKRLIEKVVGKSLNLGSPSELGGKTSDPLVFWRDGLDTSKIQYYTVRKVKQLAGTYSLEELQQIGSTENRKTHGTPCKIGKMMKKVYPESSQEDIEAVANKLLASRISEDMLELVEGEDITKLYTDNSKICDRAGNLSSSCMNGKPASFFEVYEDNEGVQTLTLRKSDGVLVGRALVWRNVQDRATKESNTFMDRIYANDQVRTMFSNYAFSKGWWMRKGNHYEWDGFFKSESDECHNEIEFTTTNSIKHYEYMPYMDTFKYHKGPHILTSSADSYCFNNTDGSWEYREQIICPVCGNSVQSNYTHRIWQRDDEYRVCSTCSDEEQFRGNRVLTSEMVIVHRSGRAQLGHPEASGNYIAQDARTGQWHPTGDVVTVESGERYYHSTPGLVYEDGALLYRPSQSEVNA